MAERDALLHIPPHGANCNDQPDEAEPETGVRRLVCTWMACLLLMIALYLERKAVWDMARQYTTPERLERGRLRERWPHGKMNSYSKPILREEVAGHTLTWPGQARSQSIDGKSNTGETIRRKGVEEHTCRTRTSAGPSSFWATAPRSPPLYMTYMKAAAGLRDIYCRCRC